MRYPEKNKFAFRIAWQVFVSQLLQVSFRSSSDGASSRCNARWSEFSPPRAQQESKLRKKLQAQGIRGWGRRRRVRAHIWQRGQREWEGTGQSSLPLICQKVNSCQQRHSDRARVVHKTLNLPHLFALSFLYWKNYSSHLIKIKPSGRLWGVHFQSQSGGSCLKALPVIGSHQINH